MDHLQQPEEAVRVANASKSIVGAAKYAMNTIEWMNNVFYNTRTLSFYSEGFSRKLVIMDQLFSSL